MNRTIRVGFTGTRQDTTTAQHHSLVEWLKTTANLISEWHHGCCIGADAEGVDCITALDKWVVIHAHPPINKSLMSSLALEDSGVKHEPKEYLARNRDIVAAATVVVACPKDMEDQTGGTWYTIRHARKQGIDVIVFQPDGMIRLMNGPKSKHAFGQKAVRRWRRCSRIWKSSTSSDCRFYPRDTLADSNG